MSSSFCSLTQLKGCLGRQPFRSFLGFLAAYFRAIILLMMKKLKEKCRTLLISIRGCLGCCAKSLSDLGPNKPPSYDRDSENGEILKNPGIADDSWSSVSCEVDLSQRSLSSLNTSSQASESRNNAGGTSNSPEFVNRGLILWNQTREQWTADKRTRKEIQIKEPRISWKPTYESLLSTDEPFPQPIPLPEMVDFLLDVWALKGLYD